MKRYLKFAASFWMSAFLITGSMASAQTTPTAAAKKKSASATTTTPAPAADTTTAPSQTTPAATAKQPTVAPQDQPAATTTFALSPKSTPTPVRPSTPAPQQ